MYIQMQFLFINQTADFLINVRLAHFRSCPKSFCFDVVIRKLSICADDAHVMYLQHLLREFVVKAALGCASYRERVHEVGPS